MAAETTATATTSATTNVQRWLDTATPKRRPRVAPQLPAPFTSQGRYDAAMRAAIWHGVRLPDNVRCGPRYRIPRREDAPTDEEVAVALRIVRDRRSAAESYHALVNAEATTQRTSREKRVTAAPEPICSRVRCNDPCAPGRRMCASHLADQSARQKKSRANRRRTLSPSSSDKS